MMSNVIEGSITCSEHEMRQIPQAAYDLLKVISNGGAYDKSSPMLAILEAEGCVKNGEISEIGRIALSSPKFFVEKPRPKSPIKRI